MRFADFRKQALVAAALLALPMAGCGGSSSSGTFPAGSGSTNPSCNPGMSPPGYGVANQISVTVNGSQCNSTNQYVNEPCASVTICTPGCDNQCQTINDLLVDTGSFGLRIFSNVLQIPLKQVANGDNAIAECIGFGDGSSEWGPVETADIFIAGEVAKNVPIMVINSGYAFPPDACNPYNSTPDTGPSQAGFNGILGVGLGSQDCGADCISDSNNTLYFSCANGDSSCPGATVPLNGQVTNPVAMFPTDNNGVILSLGSVLNGGAPSVSGTLTFGIDTVTSPPAGYVSNSSAGMNTYLNQFDDQIGTYVMNTSTSFGGSNQASFLDSGSNDLAFPYVYTGGGTNPMPDCSAFNTFFQGQGSDYFCPGTVPLVLSATNSGTSGSHSAVVNFTMESAYTLFSTNTQNAVFSTLGSPSGGELDGLFDWGIPFFYGKSVAVGIVGTQSNLGTGPLWGY